MGYCAFQGHKGYITKKMHDHKNCSGKGCRYFIKNEDHGYWFQKEMHRAEAKARRKGEPTYTFRGKVYKTTFSKVHKVGV